MAAAVTNTHARAQAHQWAANYFRQNGGPWDNQLKTPDVFLKVFIVFEHI